MRAWFGDEAMVREVASWGEHFAGTWRRGSGRGGRCGALGGRARSRSSRRMSSAPRTGALRGRGRRRPDGRGIRGIPGDRTVEDTFAAAQRSPRRGWYSRLRRRRRRLVEKAVGPGPGDDLLVLRLSNAAVPGRNWSSSLPPRFTCASTLPRGRAALRRGAGRGPRARRRRDLARRPRRVRSVLQTNPDGRKQAEGGLLWRKKTNQAYRGATSELRGADLNRYFRLRLGRVGARAPSVLRDLRRRGAGLRARDPGDPSRHGAGARRPAARRPDDAGARRPTGVYADLHSFEPALLTLFGLTAAIGDVCLGASCC